MVCALTACGGDNGASETSGPGTGDATTGAASSSSGDVDPTTGAGPTTTPDSTSGPDVTTTGDATTGPDATTGDGTTSTTTTTATTGDATTDAPETGIVEGAPSIIEDRCAPDDGPALEFKVGVTPFACDGDFPDDAPIVTVALWQGAPLAPGVYQLDNGGGFASFDDGVEVKTSMTGTISVIEWANDAPIGSFDITFPDDTKLDGDFAAIYCPSKPPCK